MVERRARRVLREILSRSTARVANLVRRDLDDYLRTLRYVKPAWMPREFAGDAALPCPDGCGFCSRHEQHLCMPIVEITSRCDLACPVCLVDAGRPWDMSRRSSRRLLDAPDRGRAADRRAEPLRRRTADASRIARAAGRGPAARPEIVRVSISTNGLALLARAGAAARPAAAQRRRLAAIRRFRRRDLPDVARPTAVGREKRQILDLLAAGGHLDVADDDRGRRRQRRPVRPPFSTTSSRSRTWSA